MDPRMRPWLGLALIGMVGFVVWLFAQMTRTPRSTRIALTLAACAGLVVIVLGVVAFLDKRRNG